MMRLRAATRKLAVLVSAGLALSVLALAPSSTETAVANGDTRTIHLFHTHTGESIDATFRVDGRYDQAVLDKLNYFLRDWRNNDQIRMDPRLFDTVWEAYRTAGADQPIQIYSAYRSPETNAMLRRRSRAVAEHSQHMLGKAMDTTMPGMSMERIREIGMKMQHGGVGYYQAANFVHLDVGGVRSWPRMGYDQLARLFPDGKTVHIPANGQPMARYEEARLEIAARGGTDVPPAQESQGFFAWLFGGSNNGAAREDEGDRTAVAARATRAQTAANANPEGDEAGANAGQAAPQRQALAAQQAPVVQAPVVQAPVVQAVAVQPEPPRDGGRQPEAPSVVAQGAVSVATARSDDQAAGVDDMPIDRFPIPPRRPAELLAALDMDLPLPPIRPLSVTKSDVASNDAGPVETGSMPSPLARPATVPDAIGGLIASHASLPAIITQGTALSRAPMPALSFASAEPVSGLRPTVDGVSARGLTTVTRTNVKRGIVALRGEHRRTEQPMASPAVAAALLSPGGSVLSAASIFGLRRAARSVSVNAAL